MSEKKKSELTREDRKMLNSVFLRTMSLSATYNLERWQALGYVYSMTPVIKRYYKTHEERCEAYKRHFALFNTTPTVGSFITGLSAAMEKEASENKDFDVSSINAVKVSLMGPFAGIGDTIFWAALRIVTLGIGIAMALQGSIMGVIVHLLLFNIVAFIPRYYGVYWGYGLGGDFMRRAVQSGVLGLVTKAAGIVGLMTVGAMVANMVALNIVWVPDIQGTPLEIQQILDSIFPFLLPLGITFLWFKLLGKGIKPVWLMLAAMAIGVLGRALGIL